MAITDEELRIQRGALRLEDAELHHHHEVWTRVQQRVGADRFRCERRGHGYGDD